jgi:hypothetical protein
MKIVLTMCDASLAKFDLRAMGRGFLQMNLYVAQQPYVCMTMCTYSPAVRGPGGHWTPVLGARFRSPRRVRSLIR